MQLLCYLSLTLVWLIKCTSALSPPALDITAALRERSTPRIERRLAPASRLSQLQQRSSRLELFNSCHVDFAEGENQEGQSSFAARMRIASEKPILLLEEIEHLLNSVECSDKTILLSFSDDLDLSMAQGEIDKLVDGFLITSHFSCNSKETRQPYRVENVTHISDTATLLTIMPVAWESSFSTISISMGYTQEKHVLRPHRDLRRRQADSTPTPTSLSFSIPAIPAPTATETSSEFDFDISGALINATLGPFPDIPVELGCKNCTTSGKVDVSWLNFDWACDLDELMTGGLQLSDCLQGGEINVVADNLGAHIELLTNVTGKAEFGIDLLRVPTLLSFLVPGVGVAGLYLAPSIVGGFEINGTAAFTYGFDVTLPSKANLYVDLSDPTNSTSTGFQDVTIDAIPMQSASDIQALILELGIRYRLSFGFVFDTLIDVDLSAGIFIDLPKYSLSIEPQTGPVDAECNPLADNDSISDEDSALLESVLTTPYLLTPSAGFGIGVDLEIALPISPLPINGIPLERIITDESVELERSCVNYNTETGTYEDAKQVFEAAKVAAQDEADAQDEDQGDGPDSDDDKGAAMGRFSNGFLGLGLGGQSLVMAVLVLLFL